MKFAWHDYDPTTMEYVESWLDKPAVESTGLDEGFRAFYEYWANADAFILGQSFWCKVVSENGTPFAVVAFCKHDHKVIIMEIVVAPLARCQGKGSQVLGELLDSNELLGFSIQESEAVIYPDNIASQKAFENAGFQYHYTHEDADGISLHYVYKGISHS